MERWLTLHNPSTAQGHCHLHQLLFLPRAAPEHHRQSPYHTHPQRLGAQSFLQPAQPALPLGQGPDALQQGPPLDTTPTEQRRGSSNADGAEPDRTNCGVVAWTAACRHLARDFAGIRQYRPADRTALASTVAAVTMGPVAAWPVRLIPHAPAKIRGPANRPQRTRQRHPSRRNNCTSSQQRYWRTAGGRFCPPPRPNADRGEHTRAAAQRAPLVARHTPRMHPRQGRRWWHTPVPSRGNHWCCRRRATRPSCTATPEGTGHTS